MEEESKRGRSRGRRKKEGGRERRGKSKGTGKRERRKTFAL